MGRKAPDETGRVYGRLTVLERADNHNKHAAWLCRCECGVEKVIQARHLRDGATRSCGCWKREHAVIVAQATRMTRRTTTPSYSTSHHRVVSEKGRAALWACVACGKAAEEWSYTGTDPDELTSDQGLWSLAHSASPSYYEPRCRKCHKAYDLKRAA